MIKKIEVETNNITSDQVFKTILNNGLKVFIYPKKGFINKKVIFGTQYGSIDNDFIDIISGERKKVPDGIAHFLEHKLFEKEEGNALDIFSKMGVTTNAYTSFDQTVYYIETDKALNICLDKFVKFISTPYFTDENVEKEKGIIGEEIKMYEDNSSSVVYENLMKAMYVKSPLKIDIAGTIESISKINKELLYTCYNTFYNPKNMFCIIIGDVDTKEILESLQKLTIKYMLKEKSQEVVKFVEKEPKKTAKKEIIKKLSTPKPLIYMGFKLEKKDGKSNIKNDIMTSFVNDIFFSNMSGFYEKLYKKNIITHDPYICYESGESFAHIIIMGVVENIEKFELETIKYIEKIKKEGVDQKIFNIVKAKKEGEYIYALESTTYIYRTIIDSIIQKTDVFEYQKILENITTEDINKFIQKNLDIGNVCISKVLPK